MLSDKQKRSGELALSISEDKDALEDSWRLKHKPEIRRKKKCRVVRQIAGTCVTLGIKSYRTHVFCIKKKYKKCEFKVVDRSIVH